MRAGMPSGKAHIEYEDVLAAHKAVRLSHSLLLDRPVRVRVFRRSADACPCAHLCHV